MVTFSTVNGHERDRGNDLAWPRRQAAVTSRRRQAAEKAKVKKKKARKQSRERLETEKRSPEQRGCGDKPETSLAGRNMLEGCPYDATQGIF